MLYNILNKIIYNILYFCLDRDSNERFNHSLE